MADKTKIEWSDATVNSVRGVDPDWWWCQHVSPGCDNCYASRLNVQRGGQAYWPAGPGQPVYIPERDIVQIARPDGSPVAATLRHYQKPLDEAMRWTRPRRIFVNSMTDTFGEWVPNVWIGRILAAAAASPWHDWLLLTKRASQMAKVLSDPATPGMVSRILGEWSSERPYVPRELRCWPLPNVWPGVTIETAVYSWRANHLRRLDPGWGPRWISAEPLLGPLVPHQYMSHELAIDSVSSRPEVALFDGQLTTTARPLDLSGVQWIVVGGESGGPPERRLVEPCPSPAACRREGYKYACVCAGTGWAPTRAGRAWTTDLLEAAHQAGAAFLFKQWGGPAPKSGGRMLLGQSWDEYPTVQREAVPA